MNILVIAAHPDDEVLGAGGTMLWHRSRGHKVYTLLLTEATGYPDCQARREEVTRVHRFLATQPTQLNFPTTRLDMVPLRDLAGSIERHVEKVRPSVLYTHFSGDMNQDHRRIFEATLIALRRHPPFLKTVYSYEILSSTEVGHRPFEPTYFVDIRRFLEKKVKAMALYARESQRYPQARSGEGIRILARARGLQSGMHAAEAFHLVRSYQREKELS